MKFKDYMVKPGSRVSLKDRSCNDTNKVKDKEEARQILEQNVEKMSKLQYLLYAENKHSLLVILQGMDTSGKDGVIRNVFSRLNPQGCKVKSFKTPSVEEMDHDFLWRVYQALPAKGDIGIFNRSHYEDVLIVRIHEWVPKKVWAERYEQINAFEKLIHQNGITVLKFFLHISKDEQGRRLQMRLDDPGKNWKISPNDFEERNFWNQYIEAYEDALEKCSTPWAPWYVIPSNKKWFRDCLVSQIVLKTLEDFDMKLPKPVCDISKLK